VIAYKKSDYSQDKLLRYNDSSIFGSCKELPIRVI